MATSMARREKGTDDTNGWEKVTTRRAVHMRKMTRKVEEKTFIRMRDVRDVVIVGGI